MNRVRPYLELIKNEELREATQKYLKHHWERFSKVPASIKFHHVDTEGLLEHTIELCDIGLKIIGSYVW